MNNLDRTSLVLAVESILIADLEGSLPLVLPPVNFLSIVKSRTTVWEHER